MSQVRSNKVFKGTSAERIALKTGNLEPTDAFRESDTGSEYEWSGSSWVITITGGAGHTLSGGSGGTANTAITSWPHTLAAHTATGAGTAYNLPSGRCTVQASSLEGAGTLTTATIEIQVSNDNVNWETAGSIIVAGDADSDGFPIDAPWAYIRSNATTFTEAVDGCTVTVTLNI